MLQCFVLCYGSRRNDKLCRLSAQGLLLSHLPHVWRLSVMAEPRRVTDLPRQIVLGYTDFEYVSVEYAAKVLRINKHTLYRAVARDEIPVVRVGSYIRIPVQFLMFEPKPRKPLSTALSTEVNGQLAFTFDVPIIPVKLWRNTGESVKNNPVTLPRHYYGRSR
jgi:excisionase family DNA binding protein